MKIGRWRTLSNGRTLVTDIVTLANRMPMAPLFRDLDLSELDALRRRVRPRLSWTVLMMKAYSQVAIRNPALRQIYTPLPFQHFYEHPSNVCMVTITREENGEPRLFFARFHSPEKYSLIDLQKSYEHFRRAPVQDIKQYRHQINFARLPVLLRKPLWWLMNSLWPRKRAQHMGTFGMSISRFKETIGTLHLGAATTILGYDLFPKNGQCRITLTFDHRVLDGKPAVDVLEDFYQALVNEITEEVKKLVARSESKLAA